MAQDLSDGQAIEPPAGDPVPPLSLRDPDDAPLIASLRDGAPAVPVGAKKRVWARLLGALRADAAQD